MNHEHFADVFPELRYSHLSKYAQEWAESFPEISRVVLYRYSTPPELVIHPDQSIPVKFAVILEARGENAAAFKKLQNATGHLSIAKTKGTFKFFIKDASFPSTVYREEPSGEFWREWMFIAVRPDEGLPSASICITRPRWVLHDSFPGRKSSGLYCLVDRLKEDPIYGDPPQSASFLANLQGRQQEPSDILPSDPSLYLQSALKEIVSALYKRDLDPETTQIEREEFKSLLREAGLPLPAFWFPSEDDNSLKLDIREREEFKTGFDLASRIDDIKEKIRQVEMLRADTPPDWEKKEELIKKLNRELEEIQDAKPQQERRESRPSQIDKRMEKNFFENLKLDTLISQAKNWAEEYRALKTLTLYRGNAEHSDCKYVFVAIYTSQDEDERIRFLNWASESCMQIHKSLPNFYPAAPRGFDYMNEWRWFSIPDGQPLGISRFIVEEDFITLFSDNQSEAQPTAEETKHEDEETGEECKRLEEIEREELYPPQVLTLIQNAKSEVNTLWAGMQSIQRAIGKDEHEDIRECYKEAALRFLEQTGTDGYITEEVLKDEFLYYYGDVEKRLDKRHHKRDFIGKLYQLLIHKNFPKELPEPSKAPRRYSVKKLLSIHQVKP